MWLVAVVSHLGDSSSRRWVRVARVARGYTSLALQAIILSALGRDGGCTAEDLAIYLRCRKGGESFAGLSVKGRDTNSTKRNAGPGGAHLSAN